MASLGLAAQLGRVQILDGHRVVLRRADAPSRMSFTDSSLPAVRAGASDVGEFGFDVAIERLQFVERSLPDLFVFGPLIFESTRNLLIASERDALANTDNDRGARRSGQTNSQE